MVHQELTQRYLLKAVQAVMVSTAALIIIRGVQVVMVVQVPEVIDFVVLL